LRLGCCEVAGDRGFIYRELADAGLRDEFPGLSFGSFVGYDSLARTCEIGLSEHCGHEFESLAYLVEEVTRRTDAALVAT
jgi:D-lactate dehydrogenase